MRRTTRRFLWLVVLMVWLVPSAARAVSIRDLVELSRAGLSDQILLAVLEADPTIFDLDADTIIEIRRAGLSERVIEAMLDSGRDSSTRDSDLAVYRDDFRSVEPNVSNPYATQPGVVVIGGRPEPPPAPTIVYVPVPIFGFTHYVLQGRTRIAPGTGTSTGTLNTQRGFGRFMNDGFRPGVAAAPQSSREPVYWGWGGKQRPGSWNVESPR